MLPSAMNELVYAYRAGNRQAGDRLYEAMRPFMGWAGKRYRVDAVLDQSEMFGMATEVLVEALNTWDETKGHKYFPHYVKRLMHWKLSTARNKTTQRFWAAPTIAMDVLPEHDDADREAQALARIMLMRAFGRATGKLARVLLLKADGKSNVEAGAVVGWPNQYVSKKLLQLKAEL